MKKLDKIKIGEFSRLTGISLPNLRYYDSVGLISPKNRGDNKYRYYSISDLGKAFLIVDLRHIGVPIKKIVDYFNIESQKNKINMLNEFNDNIETEIQKLMQIQESLKIHENLLTNFNETQLKNIEIKQLSKKTIYSHYSQIDNSDYLTQADSFIEFTNNIRLNSSYPFGQIILKNKFSSEEINTNPNFYFSVPKHLSNDSVPSGKYIIAHQLGNVETLFKRVTSFVKSNDLKIIGNAYLDYLPSIILDEKINESIIRLVVPID